MLPSPESEDPDEEQAVYDARSSLGDANFHPLFASSDLDSELPVVSHFSQSCESSPDSGIGLLLLISGDQMSMEPAQDRFLNNFVTRNEAVEKSHIRGQKIVDEEGSISSQNAGQRSQASNRARCPVHTPQRNVLRSRIQDSNLPRSQELAMLDCSEVITSSCTKVMQCGMATADYPSSSLSPHAASPEISVSQLTMHGLPIHTASTYTADALLDIPSCCSPPLGITSARSDHPTLREGASTAPNQSARDIDMMGAKQRFRCLIQATARIMCRG